MPVNVSTVKNAPKMHPDLHCGRHRGKGRFQLHSIWCGHVGSTVGVLRLRRGVQRNCRDIAATVASSALDETGDGKCDG